MSLIFSRRTLLATSMAAAATTAFALPAGADPDRGVTNLPDDFYDRDGLEGMPRLDYESMPSVNVLDFGAVGDGATPSEAAFQAATDAVLAMGGGVVRVPAGRYLFAPPQASGRAYYFRRDALANVHYLGDGEASVIAFQLPGIAAGGALGSRYGAHEGWYLPNATNVTLRNLSFTWSPFFSMRVTLGIRAVNAQDAVGLHCIGVSVENAQPSLWLARGRDVWVVDCVVRNSSSDAIHFENGIDSVAAYNYVEDIGDDAIANFTNTETPVDSSELVGVRMVHNTVALVWWGRGLTLGGSGEEMRGNWVESLVSAGIYSDSGLWQGGDAVPLYGAVVDANTVVRACLEARDDNSFYRYGTDGYQGAISLRDILVTATLTGNTLLGSQTNGVTFGIERWRPLSGTDVTVADNVVEGSLGHGIRFVPAAEVDGLTMTNNLLLGNAAGSVQVDGSVLDAETSGNVVDVAPVVDGDVSGDLTGFTTSAQAPGYRDAYAVLRQEPDQSAFGDPSGWGPARRGGRLANVRRFGARGDGRTDDTPAFYAALRSLPPEGGTIHVPAGTYYLQPNDVEEDYPDTTIRHHFAIADRDGIELRGVGAASRIIVGSVDHQGIRLINSTGSSIRSLRVELAASAAAPLRHNRALIDVSAATDCAIADVVVSGSGGPGLLVDSSSRVAVTGCRVEDAGTHGIHLRAARQVLVQDNDVTGSRDCGVLVDWMGTIAREPQCVRVCGNRIAGTSEGPGVGVTGGNLVEIVDNTIEDTYLAGIHLFQRSGHFPHRGIVVERNLLTGANTGEFSYTPGAIAVQQLRRGRTAAEVTVVGNAITRSPHHGIWVGGQTPINQAQGLADMDRLEVNGNTFSELGGLTVRIDEAQSAKIVDLQVDNGAIDAYLVLVNQFKVAIATAPEGPYEVVLEETQVIRDGSNRAGYAVDLSAYEGHEEIYFRFSDSHPEDAWGGQVRQFAVRRNITQVLASFVPTTPEEEPFLYLDSGSKVGSGFRYAEKAGEFVYRVPLA